VVEEDVKEVGAGPGVLGIRQRSQACGLVESTGIVAREVRRLSPVDVREDTLEAGCICQKGGHAATCHKSPEQKRKMSHKEHVSLSPGIGLRARLRKSGISPVRKLVLYPPRTAVHSVLAALLCNPATMDGASCDFVLICSRNIPYANARAKTRIYNSDTFWDCLRLFGAILTKR